jgi:hypothetical protein
MFALQDQDTPRAGARDLTRNGALARRLRRTAAGAVCAAAVALPLAGAATAQAATSAPHTLTNVWTSLAPQNGWFDYQNHTAAPAVTNIGGIVHLKGAIATFGSNPVPFTLPVGDRPANEVHVQVDLFAAVAGQLDITPSGVVTVSSEQGWSAAQGFTGLDGVTFAASGTSFTPLTPLNGWTSAGSGFASPAARTINGIVHLRGAIAASNPTGEAFILPTAFRPNHEVYVPVDLCNANSGRLNISPTGVVDVVAEGGNSSNADCGTSLDGAWFAPSETSFTQLTLQNGWHNYEDGTATAAVRKISGIVHLEGAIATSGSSQLVAFTLPVGFRPAHNVYVSVDMNNASKGHVLIDSNGQVTVFAEGNPSDATMFTSLDGVSFAP